MEPSPPTLQLRVARDADAARVAKCYLASYKALLHPIAPLARSDEEVESWVRDTVIPAGSVNVAIESGMVVGFIATAQRDGSAWVDHLYVHPNHLRRDVGSTLLYLALARLKGDVHLYTFEANKGARKFFEHYGFTAIAFGDGSSNDAGRPDVLYQRAAAVRGS
jgi:GNAT superfamily N-acetyltransferase